ncbi:hypothetical protein B4U80_09733 [Leptotrombidium deliense]|uniref:Uncharacterized protein n=1 Tax=Leptotrombidium deliense TaxID=299467 RepID=A0A443QF01_9ACAR|nr:hypothetical protein B4U80_09733 [Leptotrombidium deliense]
MRTVKFCGENEDRCISEVHWADTPLDPMHNRYYNISKNCATREHCEESLKKVRDCDDFWLTANWTYTNYYLLSVGVVITSLYVYCVTDLFGQ